MKIQKILFLAISLSSTAFADNLTVKLTNISDTEGHILVGLHNQKTSYEVMGTLLDNEEVEFNPVAYKKLKPILGEMQIHFNNIQPGMYAVDALHDQNDDGTLNRAIWPMTGSPSEPYGISNSAWNFFSKGDYEDALFQVNGDTEITVKVKYHFE